jgi:hypothetical protein
MRTGGRCVVEFDPSIRGVQSRWVRLESSKTVGPWFRWASVGIDCAKHLAEDVGLVVAAVMPVGNRVLASLAAA